MTKMIHTFKSCGIQAAVDSRDGTVRILDSLMYDMIPSLPPVGEMTPDLPTSIRYAFAKYDSQDLSRAYRELYDLYTSEKTEAAAEEFGKYVIVSPISEETLAKIPAGSTVVSYVTCPECAGWLTETFPSLSFEFAADGSVCDKLAGAVAVFEFTDTKNLIGRVTELFQSGTKRIAGYPADGMPDGEAAEAYEKLCRELVRMRKKGENGVFVPFAFEKSNGALAAVDGETIVKCSKGTFSAVYVEGGKMPLNAVFLKSDALIDKCAECAVVLSAR